MAIAAESAEAPKPLSAEELFDVIGPAYETAFATLEPLPASILWLLDELSKPDGPSNGSPARIVDVGCGTGVPACSKLADAGHDVLGIDISAAMVDAARERVPNAKFEKLDFRDFNPAPDSLDAMTIFFSLIAGVTQDEIRGFMKKAFRFVKPGGYLVWGTVPLAADNLPLAWMGKNIVVSSLSPEDAVDTVSGAGFTVISEHRSVFLPKAYEAGICKQDEIWEEPHIFIYARKP